MILSSDRAIGIGYYVNNLVVLTASIKKCLLSIPSPWRILERNSITSDGMSCSVCYNQASDSVKKLYFLNLHSIVSNVGGEGRFWPSKDLNIACGS